jgi:hypothetical protein
MLMRVASLLVRNQARIQLNPDARHDEWKPIENVMILTDADISNVVTRSTIVHEAVHAGQDARGLPMLAVHSECDAYIASMLYVASEGYSEPPLTPVPVLPGGDMYSQAKIDAHKRKVDKVNLENSIYRTAWRIAQRIRVTYSLPPRPIPGVILTAYEKNPNWDNIAVISDEDYENLKGAIKSYPDYFGSDKYVEMFDGI